MLHCCHAGAWRDSDDYCLSSCLQHQVCGHHFSNSVQTPAPSIGSSPLGLLEHGSDLFDHAVDFIGVLRLVQPLEKLGEVRENDPQAFFLLCVRPALHGNMATS